MKGMAPMLNMKELMTRINQKTKMLEERVKVRTKWTEIDENITIGNRQ